MCLELIYENSPNRGLVEFSYLAVNNKILVNKSYLEKEDNGFEWINTHGGVFGSYLWLQWTDNNDKKIMTALLNYANDKEWKGSLHESLIFLDNHYAHSELLDNIYAMFRDAMCNAGFRGTWVDKQLQAANLKSNNVLWRTVDFQMHVPTQSNIHPGYDT